MPRTNKKIAMIIAKKDFRDEEYFIPKGIFEEQGIEVKTISSEKNSALGSYGGTTEIDITLEDLNIKNFDAVLFIGGSGAMEYANSQLCHKIADQAVLGGKILGAICIAPIILARSGVLKGRQATVWTSDMDKSAIKILKEEGAEYQDRPVVIDDKIITANGPDSARKFAEQIIKLL